MKKAFSVIILALASVPMLFAATYKHTRFGLNLSGYVDDVEYLIVTPDEKFINGRGINLDTSSNGDAEYRYLITPSAGVPGLSIASFTLMTSKSGATIEISHTKLTRVAGSSMELDYELAVGFIAYNSDGTKTKVLEVCNSKNSVSIVLNKPSTANVSLIQDGLIYFRLIDAPNGTSYNGDYVSDVTFTLTGT